MHSILGIADAEDAITEAITRVRRFLRGDCGDIALISACTTPFRIVDDHFGYHLRALWRPVRFDPSGDQRLAVPQLWRAQRLRQIRLEDMLV